MFRPAVFGFVFVACLAPCASSETISTTAEQADFGILFGVSPFGGSMTVSRHSSIQTTWQFSIGGNPEGRYDIDVANQDYVLRSRALWLGGFVNFRPIVSASWFRVVTGFALGQIEHRLDDGSGNIFAVDYPMLPVGYLGIGTGVGTQSGFTFGFDVGWLQSVGPRISFDKGPDAGESGALTAADRKQRLDNIDDSFFFGSFMPNIQVGMGYNF
ncbi:MAG: hypothetical protein CMH52_10565 [Myxococcales bacterium]|nr:hypothetical protein [Myxococcales bacterium]|tara:strand:+ start:769 stop:1410 length:642 start_codon:yes stop_codon:yes gene_type:complete